MKISIDLVTIPTVLFLIFLVLKLTHYIDWSWGWVFSPLWIAVGLVTVILVIFLILAVLASD